MCSSRQAESNVFNMLAVFYQSWLVKSKISKMKSEQNFIQQQ